MRIGELARRAGVTPSKIRFYESRGLLPAASRQPNGYRDFGEHALQAVRFIARAQRLGFTLREVAAHLRLPEGDERKGRLQGRLERKLAELDATLAALRGRRAEMTATIDEVRRARAGQARP